MAKARKVLSDIIQRVQQRQDPEQYQKLVSEMMQMESNTEAECFGKVVYMDVEIKELHNGLD